MSSVVSELSWVAKMGGQVVVRVHVDSLAVLHLEGGSRVGMVIDCLVVARSCESLAFAVDSGCVVEALLATADVALAAWTCCRSQQRSDDVVEEDVSQAMASCTGTASGREES